jgi:hypothetical protein
MLKLRKRQPLYLRSKGRTNHKHLSPLPDLQSRLAAIAKNIETLESKVSGGSVAPAPVAATTAEQASAPSPQRSFDPLEALRRRKHELEHGHVPTAAPAPVEVPAAPQQAAPEPAAPPPAPEQPVHAPEPSATSPEPAPTPDSSGLDQLISRLDEQFSRLTDAVVDVRSIAESSAADQAGLHQQVAALKARVDNGSNRPQPRLRQRRKRSADPILRNSAIRSALFRIRLRRCRNQRRSSLWKTAIATFSPASTR